MSIRVGAQVRFAIVPEWVLMVDGERRPVASPLSDKAVRLYAVLAFLADRESKLTSGHSRQKLADMCGCSPKTIDRTLAELVTAGAVSKILRFDESESQNESDYLVKVVPTLENTWSPVSRGGDMGVSPPETRVSPPPASPVSPLPPEDQEPEFVDPSLRSGSTRGDGDAETPMSNGRPRDDLWDALVEARYPTPTNESERGKWNRAVKLLRESSATPAEILRRAAAYRRRMPNAAYTPLGLASNWASLDRASGGPVTPIDNRPDCDRCGNRRQVGQLTDGTLVEYDHVEANALVACPDCSPRARPEVAIA